MKTEIIASWKLVNKDSNKLYIITTVSGASIWVTEAQFDSNAETVTFNPMKIGDKYLSKKDKDGKGNPVEKVLKADRNEYVGCGRQIVKKYSATELLDHMASKGIVPAFNLG